MEDLTLLVMAAGMGSRFGGLKQVTPIDEEGNFIIDYSVYDAKRAGFNKVVFIIKEENLNIFESTIGNRLKDKIKVEYAFQKQKDIPIEIDISKREKPWGTVQAILSAKPYVDGKFVVINADDFYGAHAYEEAAKFLKNIKTPYSYACIAYPYQSTIIDENAVKRGVLKLEEDRVKSIIESSIEKKDGKIIATPLNKEKPFEIALDTLVSMNIFAFQPDVFEILEEYWQDYFKKSKEEILKGEALLPECLEQNLKRCKITILNRPSESKWLGMTYKSDLEIVKKEIKELKEKKEYNENLWEE